MPRSKNSNSRSKKASSSSATKKSNGTPSSRSSRSSGPAGAKERSSRASSGKKADFTTASPRSSRKAVDAKKPLSANNTPSRSSKKEAAQPTLEQQVMEALDANLTKAYSPTQLIRQLKLTTKSAKSALAPLLGKLEKEGKVRSLPRGKYQTTTEPSFILGKVDFVNPRFAFIVSDEFEQDMRVEAYELQNALDGDTVKVVSYGTGTADRRPEGEVVEVVERGRTQYVGRLEMSARYAFVIADYRKMYDDIYVRLDDLDGAKNGDKVIVDIVEWPEGDRNPVGKVSRVLGPAGENNAEIHSIMAEFDLPFEFPPQVLQEAQKMRAGITKKEIAKRRDFRPVTTFTIDPFDAKDFDDALSIRKLDNGNWEVGIHIADVTHYLRVGTLLDDEATDRATSVYLVDRVIPMLPEKLSNELCSLRPQEEKLTFSAVFELNEQSHIQNEWFGRTVIYSDRRFAYEEAQEVMDTQQGDYVEELTKLNQLAKQLRKQRFAQGAVNFETTEVKFRLDEEGNPLEVIPKVRKDAHKLVEEFMLLANRQVARFAFNIKNRGGKNTFVYRTHDYPNLEKITEFAEFAQRFGYTLQVTEEAVSRSLNKLMSAIEGTPEQDILQSIAIRSMAKAKYTTEANGHFGLAFDHYSHFTSPIRRYPDVMTHRLLQHYLEGGKPPEREPYEQQCEHSSSQEKRAADAERASVKYKQVQYIAQHEQKVFDGIVSGVTEWGVYVEMIENKCEGMIRMNDLNDDYYEYDAKGYRIIGRRRGRIISLGDKLKVRVLNTDIDRRTIDLAFER